MPNIDLTQKIERLEALEERAQIEFESLSAFTSREEDYLTVDLYGEIHPMNGVSLESNIYIKVAVYDEYNRIIGSIEQYYATDNFFGFETFSYTVPIAVKNISKLRIFPSLA